MGSNSPILRTLLRYKHPTLILASVARRRSWGALAQVDQVEERKEAWLLVVSTRFAIGKVENSGICNILSVRIDPLHVPERFLEQHILEHFTCLSGASFYDSKVFSVM